MGAGTTRLLAVLQDALSCLRIRAKASSVSCTAGAGSHYAPPPAGDVTEDPVLVYWRSKGAAVVPEMQRVHNAAAFLTLPLSAVTYPKTGAAPVRNTRPVHAIGRRCSLTGPRTERQLSWTDTHRSSHIPLLTARRQEEGEGASERKGPPA